MSHPRKKNSQDEISLFSFTEKVRQGPKPQTKKTQESRENAALNRSAVKSKENARSMKRQIKKKFLQAEVEKLLQKREFTSDTKLKEIKNMNNSDISGLREDMQSMKEAISKLSFEQKSNKSQEKKKFDEGQLQLICLGYRKKIGEVQEELEIQKQANSKLEEAHIQSQVFAQQTKDFSESIKQQLTELASKHIKCEENIRDLEEARRTIRKMTMRERELEDELRKSRENEDYLQAQVQMANRNTENEDLRKMIQQLKDENMIKTNQAIQLEQQLSLANKNNEQLSINYKKISSQFSGKCKEYQDNIAQLQNACQQLQEQKQTISQSLLAKIKEIHSSFQVAQSQNSSLKQQNEYLLSQIQHLRQELQNLSSGGTCNTQELQICHTENASSVGVDGLESMERKCEELYEQIKREKYKWDLLNTESNQEKKHYEAEVGSLSSECETLRKQLANKENSITQSQRLVEQLKKQKQQLQRQLDNSKSASNKLQSNQEELKKKKEELQSKNDDLMNSLKKLKEQRDNVNSKIQDLNQRIGQICQILAKQKDANEFYAAELLRYEDQCQHLNTELLSQKAKCQQLDKSSKELTLQLSKAECARKVLIQQFSQQKSHLQAILQQSQAETNQWKKEHSMLQEQQQIQRQSSRQIQDNLKQSQSKLEELSLQITRLTESTKRSEQQMEWYAKQIALKNKSIYQLKQTLKLVKDESIRIKEEVEYYQQQFQEMNLIKEEMSQRNSKQMEEFNAMAQKQIEYMKSRLDDLQSDKVDLQHHLRRLGEYNEQLIGRLNELNNDCDQFISKEQYQQMQAKQQQITAQLCIHKQEICKREQQIRQLSKQLQHNTSELSEKDKFITWQQGLFNQRITELQAKYQQTSTQANNTQQLLKSLSEKDELIKTLTLKNTANEQKRMKIVNEIHSIQNKISELAQRNNQLQQQNSALTLSNQQYEQQISILTKNQHFLQEQKQLLQNQSKLLHLQITQWKEREIVISQKKQKEKKEILQTCQTKLVAQIAQLKGTIKDLANELTGNIKKISSKNQEIESLKTKYREVQEILKENHEILSQQRSQREKLSHSNTQCILAVENYKAQISLKDKEIQALTKEKSISLTKFSDLSSKYQSLKSKYQSLQHQRHLARKQIQNQSLSLRVLRQQNKNIEKVMSDQLNQRKAIIQQLVNEKRMLYSHLQHQ